MKKLLTIALAGALGACVTTPPAGAPPWVDAGSGARHTETGRTLLLVAYLPPELFGAENEAKKVEYLAKKHAERLVVKLRELAPEGNAALEETGLLALKARLAKRARVEQDLRYESPDGLYLRARIDVDPILKELDDEELVRWFEAAFEALRKEDRLY